MTLPNPLKRAFRPLGSSGPGILARNRIVGGSGELGQTKDSGDPRSSCFSDSRGCLAAAHNSRSSAPGFQSGGSSSRPNAMQKAASARNRKAGVSISFRIFAPLSKTPDNIQKQAGALQVGSVPFSEVAVKYQSHYECRRGPVQPEACVPKVFALGEGILPEPGGEDPLERDCGPRCPRRGQPPRAIRGPTFRKLVMGETLVEVDSQCERPQSHKRKGLTELERPGRGQSRILRTVFVAEGALEPGTTPSALQSGSVSSQNVEEPIL